MRAEGGRAAAGERLTCYRARAMTIDVDDYPQLALIAWNRRVRAISAEEAFELYERNPQWVDRASMDEHERALLDRLIVECGQGVWNG